METRVFFHASRRLRPFLCAFHTRTRTRIRHSSTSNTPSTQQVHPLGDYYASILESPTPKISIKPPTTATPSSKPPEDDSKPEAAILFSSRLSSPLERRSEIKKKSVRVAGVWVPPRPDEPDNCCMSGCVNCVWDRYRDELEEWAAARKEVNKVLRMEKVGKKRPSGVGLTGSGLMLGEGEKGAQHTMVSMDDDGGGSECNWGTMDSDFSDEGLFKGIPVGIREFMRSEKRLKEKHAARKAEEARAG
ncbi:Uncharacterized protein BP5553_01842 [Venustampulla echinocandica]|uniref:Oxidoreductase-like domain-containing protein n=1 Tax=Venustampulla echinocandica TaxID=2656787 RepID=A0A370U2A0_9HELO|nr:Uncharacterized protein BP5553_01842 [Venustampulla echinocandica]RDL41863.1 Uncharacterized protein BP5553_01842 [Venustampulla echinocandica]